MTTASFRKCPLCGTNKYDMIHKIHYGPDPEGVLPEFYNIISCKDCGFVYDDFTNMPEILRKYYKISGKYSDANLAGGGGANKIENKNWRRIYNLIAPYIKPESRILDVGCGKGGLLAFLSKQGYKNLIALDPSPDCIEYARKKHGLGGFVGELKTLQKNQLFELILLTGVLEHLANPKDTLRLAITHLAQDGVIFIEIPDASSYTNMDEPPFYFFDREHVNHFTQDSLTLLCRILGLRTYFCQKTTAYLTTTRTMPSICGIFSESDTKKWWRTYLENSLKKQSHLTISDNYSGNSFLWGIGAYAQYLLASGFFEKISLTGLVDIERKKQGKVIHGVEITSPEILSKYNFSDSIVFITSVVYTQQIESELKNMGWQGKIISLVSKNSTQR